MDSPNGEPLAQEKDEDMEKIIRLKKQAECLGLTGEGIQKYCNAGTG